MANERVFQIYISSTVDDLKEERKIAIEIASKFGLVKLTRGAESVPVVDACLRDVRESDVYVGIIGMRYGWQPDRSVNPELKSITELEYDACADKTPRLVFYNAGRIYPDPPYTDADTTLVKRFRERAKAGLAHMAHPFDNDAGDEAKRFALALERALHSEKERFRLRWGEVGGAMGGAGRPREDLLKAIALLGVAGADDLVVESARGAADSNVTCSALRLDHVDWWTEMDRCWRLAQSPCMLLTHAGLAQLRQPEASGRVVEMLSNARACGRPVTLVLAGTDPSKVPPAWSDGLRLSLDEVPTAMPSVRAWLDRLTRAIDSRTPAIEPLGNPEVDLLHRQWHAAANTRSALDKVALPVIIVAPTIAEINSLVDPSRSGFAGYDKALKRRQRLEDFRRLQPDRKRRDAGWPGDTYSDDRAMWRCFGPDRPPALAHVLHAVKAINAATVGSRERRLLPRMRAIPRLYRFDDLLSAQPGRPAALLDAASAGALVLVDEFALLHPRLRAAIKPLLDLPRAAAASISASDPIHSKTADLLDEDSFLQVGQFMRRYQVESDPQCELALNSAERLERWIRMVVPEMLALGSAGEARRDLASRADEMLESTSKRP